MQATRTVTTVQPKPKVTKMEQKVLAFAAAVAAAKRKVAGYARVSTDMDEQQKSYDAQVEYYTEYIQANEAWEFVDVYTDEGISGTSTKGRKGFNQMIEDAMAGKIQLIVTKSVSRFARNTVDTLSIVRALKDQGVEVFFQKENIYTLDAKGELLITIMASLAQEESRSISENVSWGKRKQFENGKVSMPYKRFLGYEKGADGLPQILEEEAEVVRWMYARFLEGKSPSAIATMLNERGVPTPGKKTTWRSKVVESILTNEKYKGDAILQKTFTVNFLTKKQKVNEGELPQFYVERSHPAIIEPEVYDIVQHELAARKASGQQTWCTHCFSGKIVCGRCGEPYRNKVWHAGTQYRKVVWECRTKLTRAACSAHRMDEATIQRTFVEAVNRLISNKAEIITEYTALAGELFDTGALEAELARAIAERDVCAELARQCVEENARTAQEQGAYQARFGEIEARLKLADARVREIQAEIAAMGAKRFAMEGFIRALRKQDGLVAGFDEAMWFALVDKVVILNEKDMVRYVFKGGIEIAVGY